MLFKIGIEPGDDNTAFGIVIPALCQGGYGAFSAADTFEEIVPNTREAAFLILKEMATNGDLDIVNEL
ncbi:type II toxin-antitoxin system HicB family antitoxin [Algicola sagamiensis]|uniref:type II toxin-antitoxin system HicB family antitoxin n=1 Tax=Algicola sagamiensis TaxID=163869 RepID=UPI0003638051|nr:type II toxin-antitoxin system HicB family antitoxin [Algicola sagamiensis]